MKIIKHKASEKTKRLLLDVSPDYTKLKDDFQSTLNEVAQGNNEFRGFPKLNNNVEKLTFEGFNTYALSHDENSDFITIYIHGGGFLYGLDPLQFKFCDELCTIVNSDVFLIDYGLPLKYKWSDAYKLLDAVYEHALRLNKPIYILGDSSGGGLALSYVEYLKSIGSAIPQKQVLISPWLDITMSNDECKNYENKDPFLGIEGLIKAGQLWAPDIDGRDFRVSPIFGDINNLPDTLITLGSLEVFYPDIMDFVNKLDSCGNNVKLLLCEGSFHVYPFWEVGEADFAKKVIFDFLKLS